MYYSGMSQPKTPPVSFRPPPEMLADIDVVAADREMTRHAAILWLLGRALAGERGLSGLASREQEREAPGPAPVAPMAKLDRLREIVRAKPAGRFMGTTALGEELPPPKPFNPQPKKGKK